MAKSKEDQVWQFIIDNNIATEDECTLVTKINGYSVEKLNDIIEIRTGYHDVEQLRDCDEPYDYSMLDFFDTTDLEDDELEDDDDWDQFVVSNAYGPDC